MRNLPSGRQSAAADPSGVSQCTQKRAETCIYYNVQSGKRKTGGPFSVFCFCFFFLLVGLFLFFFWPSLAESLCCLEKRSRGQTGAGRGGGFGVGEGGSLDSRACTEVSVRVLALMEKVPSSLLDCQLEEKRKLGVRQKK